jgi:hypothetical protein
VHKTHSVSKLEFNVFIVKICCYRSSKYCTECYSLEGLELCILLFSGYWAEILAVAVLFLQVMRLRMCESPACAPHVHLHGLSSENCTLFYLPVYWFNY